MNKWSIKLGKNSLFSFAVIFYVFSVFFCDGTIIFNAAVVILNGVGALYILKTRRFRFCWHWMFFLLFILYNVVMITADVYPYPSVALKRLQTVFLNFLCNLIVFFYALDRKNRRLLFKGYTIIGLCLILYILVMNGSSLFKGRFGASTKLLFGLSGVNGQTFNSNSVAIVLFSSFVLTLILFWEDRDYLTAKGRRVKITLLAAFVFFTILTGSRKGLIMTASFLMLAFYLRSGTLQKKLKSISAILIVVLIAYYLIMHVEALYQIVGRRMEVLINGFLSDEGFERGTSAFYRESMQKKGMAMFWERPMTGWGLDYYSQAISYGTYSHNNFVELLVSCGMIGFLIYYGAFAYNLYSCCCFFGYDYSHNESIILFAYSLSALIMHVGIVQYVDRKSLIMGFIVAAAIVDWKKNCRAKVLSY